MIVINDHSMALGLVMCLSIFSFLTDAMPSSPEKDENTADVRDGIGLRRQKKIRTASSDSSSEDLETFKTTLMNDARMVDGNFPDIEIMFSDLQRYEKESLDHRKQADKNAAVNFVDQTLSREQRATPNVELKDEDEETFNIELIFFPWQSDTSEGENERQIAQNGSESVIHQTLLREQKSSPKIEPIYNNEGLFDIDRMLDLFWPWMRFEKKELMLEAKPTERIGAIKFVDNDSLGKCTVPNVGEQDNEDGAFNLERELDTFRPQSKKKKLGHDKKQDNQIGAMKFADHTLLRGQLAAPNVEERDNEEGAFDLEKVVDFSWPQPETKFQTSIREQQAVPNFEERENEEGVFNLEGVLDFFWPQSKKVQTRIREQRNVPSDVPWKNEGVIKQEEQDFLWPQSSRTDTQDYDTEQVDENGDVHFTDHTSMRRTAFDPYVEARDIEEGVIEPTTPPKKSADFTYESNMLYYFLTITLPAFFGISLSIILCCFCLRINGYCCRLFDARPPEILEEDSYDGGEDNRDVKL